MLNSSNQTRAQSFALTARTRYQLRSLLCHCRWFVPVIGHMGIADSEGVIHDFAGPYHVSVDHFSFGKATRYLQLDPAQCRAEAWDEAVANACEVYRGRMHNLCCDNCHSHVGNALDKMDYAGRPTHYDMVTLCFWMLFKGKFVSCFAVLQQWGPFCAVLLLLLLLLK
jgi:transmembrane protein 222